MHNKLSILCVHQGYELYGSDRMFIQSLKAIRSTYPDANLTVHIPQLGPIVSELKKPTDTIISEKLFVLRRGQSLFKIIFLLFKNTHYCFKLTKYHDIIYINTSVVLPYILLSKFTHKKFILHIHEIPTGIPKLYFYIILKWSKAHLVVNSHSTGNSLPIIKKHTVIYNGIDDAFQNIPKESSAINILLVGRVNSWKGHLLAVEAFNQIKNSTKTHINLHMVGGCFENKNFYLLKLKALIKKYRLQNFIKIIDFTTDIHKHYEWADIVLVPSLKPEPFGLVAIEAMSHQIPVIAANHGGLPEIVVHDVTGQLFKPNCVNALIQSIQTYLSNPELLETHGKNGRARFLNHFQQHHYIDNFSTYLKSVHD